MQDFSKSLNTEQENGPQNVDRVKTSEDRFTMTSLQIKMSWETSTPFTRRCLYQSLSVLKEQYLLSEPDQPKLTQLKNYLSDGKELPASPCPGGISCCKSPLVLTDCVSVEIRKPSCLFVSVPLFKEL